MSFSRYEKSVSSLISLLTLQGNSIVLHLHLEDALSKITYIALKVCILSLHQTDGLDVVCEMLYWLSLSSSLDALRFTLD